MVVDDTVANLKLLEEILGKEGYAVRTFPLGRLALAAAAQELPDLILLDIQMPEMDGFAVCESFKANPVTAPIPIVFISGQQDTADKVRAFTLGGVDYVTKPFHFAEVLVRVRTHLELRRQKLALQESYERLQEVEQLRDSLAHMVVHDMRSPLFAIMMSLELVQMNVAQPTPKVTKYLDMAVGNVNKLTEMVNQLLDISRLEAGRMPMNKARGDLVTTAQAVVEACQTLAADRRIVLVAPEPVLASYDKDLVGRILTNLVGNALKFTPVEEDVRITVSRVGSSARFAVTDQGPGIPAEYREKIFEKYTQLEGEKRKYGTGLGLTFCKLAVAAHEGEIGVESIPEQSNTFWFSLPIND